MSTITQNTDKNLEIYQRVEALEAENRRLRNELEKERKVMQKVKDKISDLDMLIQFRHTWDGRNRNIPIK